MPDLTGVCITFDTHNDNKNDDTVLHVFVKNRSNTTAGSDSNTDFISNLLTYQRYLDGGDLNDHGTSPYLAVGIGLAADEEFEEGTSRSFDLDLLPKPVSLDDIVLPVVNVHMLAKDDDRWIFDYTVRFTFDDDSEFSFSSKESGIPGIILNHNNRNHSSICAELRPLPVPDRPATNAVLKKVTLDFVTHDDNKNDDTRLDVRIRNRRSSAASDDIAVGLNLFPGEEFPDDGSVRTVSWPSDDGVLTLPEIPLADLVLPEVDITIDPDGSDRWIFDYRLTLEFADPADFAQKRTVFSSRAGGIILDQNNNRHIGVYNGSSFPTVAARTAPPLVDLPAERITRQKTIPLAFVRRKLDEFVNNRNGADDGPNPPLRKIRLHHAGEFNDDTLPETYLDARSIVSVPGGVNYVSSPLSLGQIRAARGLGDLYLRDINSATLSIDLDPARPGPLQFVIDFETEGIHETRGGLFATMDFLEFCIDLKLTLALGTTVDEAGIERTVVDVLHWITEIQEMEDSVVEVDPDPETGERRFHYTGTFLGEPVDFVSPVVSVYRLFIDTALDVNLITSEDTDPGGFFRVTARDTLFDTLTSRDKLTGRTVRDGINSLVTSWLLGGAADDSPDIDGNNTVLTDIRFQDDNLVVSYEGPRKAFIPPTPADWPPPDFGPGTLSNIEHIVVLMMENRSFDHMLGYLSIPVDQGGGGRSDVDGLKGGETNAFRGTPFPVFALTDTLFSPDPPHGFAPVTRTINGGLMDGFVEEFAREAGSPIAGRIMGYHTASTVPVFDSLARDFAVGHRWFSSHPGPTFCNRFYELTGWLNVDGQGFWELDNSSPLRPIFTDTILDYLTGAVDPVTGQPITWAYFEHGVGFLRFFERHTFNDEHVIAVDDPERGFFARARTGNLPHVSIVDPRFVENPPDSNCDGPPADIAVGQDFIERLVEAVIASPAWDKTLLLIIYDEHGGFYDHVPPSAAARVSPELPIDTHGVRVPAFVISPWVGAGTVFGQDAPPPDPAARRNDLHFDHTSIPKTIARRFLSADPPFLGARYAAANDLSAVIGTQQRAPRFRPFLRHNLQFAASQLILGPSDGNAVPGAEMWQVPRDGSAAQDFSFEDAGNDTFYIRNRRSNLYLTAQEDAPGSEALAVTLEVKHAPDSIPPVANRQKWALLPASARDRFLIESLAARGRVLQPVNVTQPGPVVLDVNAPLPPVDSNEWTVNSPLLNAEPGP